jgi:hypothetical protein
MLISIPLELDAIPVRGSIMPNACGTTTYKLERAGNVCDVTSSRTASEEFHETTLKDEFSKTICLELPAKNGRWIKTFSETLMIILATRSISIAVEFPALPCGNLISEKIKAPTAGAISKGRGWMGPSKDVVPIVRFC